MIRLQSISLNRFRGVREGTIRDFADVMLLVSRNNCGKSTVAEAITRLAYQCGRPPSRTDIWGRNPEEMWTQARNEGKAEDFWYRGDRSQVTEIHGEVGEGKTRAAAKVSLKMEAAGNTYNQNPAESFMEGGTTKVELGRFLSQAAVFRPPDGTNLAIENNLWPKLLATRRDKALTNALNEIFDTEAEGFALLPERKLVLLFSEYSLPLDVQGDGPRTAMRCLMVLALLRDTLFIVEEAESHQHPGSLQRFASAMCRQAKEQKVQLLITTQSSECVRAFLEGADKAKSESAVIHLKLDNGSLDATRLAPDAVQTLQETGLDVRFLDLYG